MSRFSFIADYFIEHKQPIQLDISLDFPPSAALENDDGGESSSFRNLFAELLDQYLVCERQYFMIDRLFAETFSDFLDRNIAQLRAKSVVLVAAYYSLNLGGARPLSLAI